MNITKVTAFRLLDYEATLMNALTCLCLRKANIPIRMPTEQKALQASFLTLGPKPAEVVRAVIIRDTLHVLELWASTALLNEHKANPLADFLEQGPLEFDAEDRLQLSTGDS